MEVTPCWEVLPPQLTGWIDEPHLNFLHRDAYSAGIDFMHYWKDRTYYLHIKQSISQVNGSEEAITNRQEASQRFFQWPDPRNRQLDTTRTDLTGMAGTIKFGKMGDDIMMET
ncbi:MAG TPA: hypothetical protein DDY13_03565 [Cytophagales bacterium]|jgi:hypothetical protein|nr:hypothetical protein [Cytophagales bacterium]